MKWIVGVAERCDFPYRRQHVAKHFDAFAVRLCCHERHACDVPARARQACDSSCFDRIGDNCNNGNIARRSLRGACAWCVERDEDVDLCRHQFGRQLGKQVEPSLRRADVELNVSSFDIARFRQSLPHLLSEGSASAFPRISAPIRRMRGCCAGATTGHDAAPAARATGARRAE